MADFEDEQPKLTLEKILAKAHQEVGETITRIGGKVSDIPDFISRFLQGQIDLREFNEVYDKGNALGYIDLVEKAKPLFDQARGIWLEKGYRHQPALNTLNEHLAVGSSGYGQFESMPNTVISIANQTLRLREEKNPMTLEEIRRARILYGMPNIDDTGTVTGEIVPITDSYHFLSEGRKAEVKELEQQIISGLKSVVYEAVARRVAELTKYKDIIRNLAEGWVSRPKAYAQLQELNMLSDVADEAIKLAYQDGRKDDILTPMEIMLLGRKVDEQYKSNPYMPLGIQRGRLSAEEANKARAEERYFDVETDVFSGYLHPVALSLEPLNAEGKTERGPLVLDHREKEPIDARVTSMWKGSVKPILFTRPPDWYHKPNNAP